MRRNKYKLLFLFQVLIITSCIKSYYPEITTLDAYKLVVSGVVTDRNQAQIVTITRASSINKPVLIPVINCTVTISDDKGHQFPLVDSANGNYYGWIDPKYLIPGSSFMVEVITPEGDRIRSDFDKFGSSPEIDSVYYNIKTIPTNDPAKDELGIQFYIDLNGDVADSKSYRFETIETWEYHSQYPKEMYFFSSVHYEYPPDYSMSVCWSSFVTRDIYIVSTENVVGNKYKQFPLHFVNNHSAKLVYGYSLLVNQYSLSDAAYKYWNQLRINTTTEGGLYEKQPMAANGNLRNQTHPEQEVLGFFGASSVKSRRIFIKDIKNLPLETDPTCASRPVTYKELAGSDASFWPIYLLENHDEAIDAPYLMLGPGCVDCRELYGTLTKPDFWPL